MKIISNKRYEELNRNTQINKVNEAEVVRLETKISKMLVSMEETARLNERAQKEKQEDHEIALQRKDEAVQSQIDEATKDLNKSITSLTIENANYKKEVEILTKAFTNLGFDVKDMKSILDKLVEGVISKNTVNVIKS